MAKSSKFNEYNTKVVTRQVKPKASVPEELVNIQLVYNVKYVYMSKRGNRLVWSGAGSINSVSREDATELLSKTKVGGCCGGHPRRSPIFKEI